MSNRKRKYSDEQLIEIMKKDYEINGEPNINKYRAKNGLPNFASYLKSFGSWNNAKSLANIPINNKSTFKISNEDIVNKFTDIVNKLGYVPRLIELNNIKDFYSTGVIFDHFKNYGQLIESANIPNIREYGTKFKNDFLISEIQRFVLEFGRIPKSDDFNNLKGYPTRKTFTNHFKTFNNVLFLAGFEPVNLDKYKYCKKYLLDQIYDFYYKNNKVPTLKEINKSLGYDARTYYRTTFGSWNKALTAAELPLNSVGRYTDEFLESEFLRFVNINGRIPRGWEFNISDYPSFWCYQNRFGSWNKAVIHYGFSPNDENRRYILEDGEDCRSLYEFDVSTWLKNNNIKYERNILYKDFIDNYNGKMDCDYLITYNNQLWYIEVAGFLSDRGKVSKLERIYFFKLLYKIKLLERQKLNYRIIKTRQLKTNTMEEIFDFIIKVE